MSAPIQVLLQRVLGGRANPYASSPAQRAGIARDTREVEPLLRRGATAELDGRAAVTELADRVEHLLAG